MKNKLIKNKKFQKNKTHDLGFFSENLVMLFLWLKGYIIIKHRFKYKDNLGDVDIIAISKKTLIFIEVKSSIDKINNEKVLSEIQIDRMYEIAEYFLFKNNNFNNFKIRYDFIEIQRFLKFFFKIKHYKNFIS